MSLIKQVTGMLWTIPSFRFWDNSIHLQECSPFWVGIFKKKNTVFTVWCRHAHSVLQSTEAFLYVIGKSNIRIAWTWIIVLEIYGKHNFKLFTTLYIHIIEIPTNKGTNSDNSDKLKLLKIGNRFLHFWIEISHHSAIATCTLMLNMLKYIYV